MAVAGQAKAYISAMIATHLSKVDAVVLFWSGDQRSTGFLRFRCFLANGRMSIIFDRKWKILGPGCVLTPADASCSQSIKTSSTCIVVVVVVRVAF